ncbi:hypothetical protein LS73_006035 [Helicobacter muridarum]|uniref:Bifunctional tRNA (Mnm(5)s(2)U34)-methyltransferase/FAD-dependent cmnm(5)s(2)U34 oxidoreductase n=1 Tax=Helicobacter muridarum TaxID=216 RepID=A0A099U0V2_9HELI|nr:MnmC family methyltransferase [Helicobacter muridarum]TLD99992.1 hypothetical protein LS73_006035 [Helicobacter muridarum]STQ87064.1 bifunctional tRNA (mnm(5)s(2)U34)-methyltransferase/FAD-dependent cmnm(5)s(2)U34 oxidoreductase [Helicobacter muridarum]
MKHNNLSQFNEHKLIECKDFSFSLYNTYYKQSYHSKSLGAYKETLYKHIIPAIIFQECLKSNTLHDFNIKLIESINKLAEQENNKNSTLLNTNEDFLNKNMLSSKSKNRSLRILDICFGLGFNAFISLQSFPYCEIYSPEKDNFLEELKSFPYPKQICLNTKQILEQLQTNRVYTYININNDQKLYFLHGDALGFLHKFPNNFFDIVFQDAFSQAQNGELWSKEYFEQLFNITSNKSIITTYAKARNILESANNSGFSVIKHKLGSVFYKG